MKLSQGVLEEEGNFLRVDTFSKAFDLNMGCGSGTECCRERNHLLVHVLHGISLLFALPLTLNCANLGLKL